VRIDGHTKLGFVLGHPVGHNLSPAMHQAAFAAAGQNAAYLPWAVLPDRLPLAVQGLRAMENLLGAKVTFPHKEAILPFLDGLTAEAEAMGAVNTLFLQNGGLLGDNTVGPGFLAGLNEDLGCEAQVGRPGPSRSAWRGPVPAN
jgi:shikimate dehydrogenase